jgi:hypothetical protein
MPEIFDPSPDASAAPASPDHASKSSLTIAPETEDPPAIKPRPRAAVRPVKLAIPLELSPASCLPGYASSRLDDVTLNAAPQRLALKLLTSSLVAYRAELNDGARSTPFNGCWIRSRSACRATCS